MTLYREQSARLWKKSQPQMREVGSGTAAMFSIYLKFALNHPNILTIYEFNSEGDFFFLAAEYIDGETLRSRISHGKLILSVILNIVEQIASALSTAHKAKINHRDVKPENIMLREDGFAKILDFGLAKLTEKHELIDDLETQTPKIALTRRGSIMGTAFYMSPEQIRGRADIDARTDIWSLGVVLFEMLTGQVPFAGDTMGDVIASILKNETPPLSKYIADAPPELEKIIEKALAKNVTERYQKVREIVSDLKKLKTRLEFETQLERSKSSDEVPLNVPSNEFSIADNETKKLPNRLTTGNGTIRLPNSVVLDAPLFRSKDRIRLNIKTVLDGYLYILNEGPKDVKGETSFNILFPTMTTHFGDPLIRSHQQIQSPQKSWFELDDKEGTELVWLIWSENPLPKLDSAMEFANEKDSGKISDSGIIKFITALTIALGLF